MKVVSLILICLTSFYSTVLQGASIVLNASSGNGRGNQWSAGGANVGDDNSAIGGTASTTLNLNQTLSVPVSDASVAGIVQSVNFRNYLRCPLCTTSIVNIFIDDNSGTFVDSQNFSVPSNYTYIEKAFALNPIKGAAWTWAEINALNVGVSTFALSAGTVSSDHIEVVVTYDPAPALDITAPGAGNVTYRQGQNYNITFSASDDAAATVALYYDTDTINCSGTGTSIVSGLSKTSTSYSWGLNTIPPGTYYICGVINDGVNTPAEDYSAGTITVSGNTAPTVSLTNPGAGGANIEQGNFFSVNFSTSDIDTDPLSLSLYYDTDTSSCTSTGTLITNTLNDTHTFFNWNTTSVSPGTYYLCGVVSDGVYSSTSYSLGALTIRSNNPDPTINISAPGAGNVTYRQGQSYNITFSAADDAAATVALYYDTDTINCSGTGTSIVSNLSKSATSYTWGLSTIPPGTYYICGVINDGVNSPAEDYSAGTITVQANTPPTLSITTPGSGGASTNQGNTYTVGFTSYDDEADPLNISLYFDNNTIDCTGTGTLITSTLNEADTFYSWDTTGVPSGNYYLCAIASDGVYTFNTYSVGSLSIQIPGNSPPTGSFLTPNSAQTVLKSESITTTFSLIDNEADNLSVSLYYDTDNIDCATTGTLLSSNLDHNSSGFSWDTTSVAPGNYYLCMTISDGINGIVEIFSTSTIQISDLLFSKEKNEFNGKMMCGYIEETGEPPSSSLPLAITIFFGMILPEFLKWVYKFFLTKIFKNHLYYNSP